MSVPMALVDFIPVILFLITGITLQRDLYNKMSKGAFAVFSTGTIMVVTAGAYKALWKLLYGMGVCDFAVLSAMMMPLQATGFFLTAAALIALMTHKQSTKAEPLYAVAPAVFKGTMIFVSMMCLGIGVLCAVMSILAVKLKKKGAIALFVLAFIGMLGMGYLSSKDFSIPAMNWMAEGVNVLGQGALLAGTVMLHKAGLPELKLTK